MKPNDRPQQTGDSFETPTLFVMVDEKYFPVPGLETAFVDYSVFNTRTTGTISECICNLVTTTTTVCVCNKMRPVCNCVGHTPPASSRGSSVITGCSCAPVH